jgi:hypothetical protein
LLKGNVMHIVRDKITLDELKKMSEKMYSRLVKAVVDIENNFMVIDVEMHVDAEMCMLDEGSKQEFLWDINIHPELSSDDWIEFDSMINIRPSQNNRTRGVDDKTLQEKIKQVVSRLVIK